jgi:transposase
LALQHVESLLPASDQIQVDSLRIEPTFVEVRVHATAERLPCLDCATPSGRVHSRYERTIRDLPWRGTAVRIRWRVRRFFCDNPGCRRVVFSEQLPDLAAKRRRGTPRLDRALVRIGLEAGGEPGARLAAELGLVASGDTILRRLRGIRLEPHACPRAIGVDDFAFCKRRAYGTILVDHDVGRPVELFQGRDAEPFQRWLGQNPGVRFVTRDRWASYASAVSQAAPSAVQVADRWHLLANARTALVHALDRHHREIRDCAAATPADQAPGPTPATARPLSKEQLLSQERRARRLARYERVLALHAEGKSQREIARQLGMKNGIVSKFLRAGSFPERAKPVRRSRVDRFGPTLRRWWDEGDHNARSLFERVRAEGYAGGRDMVRRFVAPWRTAAERERLRGPTAELPPKQRPVVPSSNRLSWLMLHQDIERSDHEHRLLGRLAEACGPLRLARDLVVEFGDAVRRRDLAALDAWTSRARRAEVPLEVRSFAEGILRDWPEVAAAIEHAYSNGRTEGHVNRLKLIKRKMYGRAKFDLLRIRVLASGP